MTQPIHTPQAVRLAESILKAAGSALKHYAPASKENILLAAQKGIDDTTKELVQAVEAAKQMSDWFMEHSRQADHAHEELKQPLHETAGWKELVDSGYNGLMASYHGQFEDALEKVKGDAA